MTAKVTVGLSQRIQLDWLERTAMLCASGANQEEIRQELDLFLQDKLSIGTTSTGQTNRRKAVTNLQKIWVSVPDSLVPFRNAGLLHLQRLPAEAHLPLHWGMTMAVYPFFYTIVENTGRLLKLQGTVAAAQVYRRVQEQLGERSTVARATRRVLRSLNDWAVLEDTAEKGIYRASPVNVIEDTQLRLWLIEAVLLASNAQSSPLRAASQTPALFPFSLQPLGLERTNPTRLDIAQQGLDEKVVMLR